MSEDDRDFACRRFDSLLVDYVDGVAGGDDRVEVEAHCASCASCAESLRALAEVPTLLRAEMEEEVASDQWARQRRLILEAVDEVVDARRPRGFDYRLLLPVAAAMVIGLAGVLSLRTPDVDVSGTHLARAAFDREIRDPLVRAEVAEVVGVPLFESEELWSDGGSVGSAAAGSGADTPRDDVELEDLEEEDLDEIEEIVGLGSIV